MKISQEVRVCKGTEQVAADQAIEITMLDNPLEGMRQKIAGFRDTSSELYHPAVGAKRSSIRGIMTVKILIPSPIHQVNGGGSKLSIGCQTTKV